jgi:beta-lactamase class D
LQPINDKTIDSRLASINQINAKIGLQHPLWEQSSLKITRHKHLIFGNIESVNGGYNGAA